MLRCKLRWSKKNGKHPKPGEVWTTHQDKHLWLILQTARRGWTNWQFDALNLETGQRDFLYVGKAYIPQWRKQF